MRSILTTLLFCILSVAHAQQTYVHDFAVGHDVTSLNEKVAHYKVIDKRNNTADFGYIVDYSTRKKQLVTAAPLQEAVEKFANVHFINTAKGADTILFIIRSLYVEHKPTNLDFGTVYICADAFRGSNEQYRLLYHIDSFCLVNTGNLARNMLSHLNETLCFCLKKALNDSLFLSSATAYTVNDAVRLPEIEKGVFPAYQTQRYKKGVYMNWQEFLMQMPSVTAFKVVEYEEFSKTKPGLYKVNKGGKLGERIKAGDYFALYDGKWYKSEATDVPEIKFVNGDYYVNVKVETASEIAALSGKKFTSTNIIEGYLSSCSYLMKIDYKTGKCLPVKLFR